MKTRMNGQKSIAAPGLRLLVVVLSLAVPLLAQTTPANEAKPADKRSSITGKVLADDGQPLVGVGVYLSRATGDRAINRAAATDEEGNFKANDLPPGSYRINAQVNGYVTSSRASLTQRYRVGESATITLVKGGAITGKVYDSAG